MRVTDTVTGERLSVDEAYERFFDGFSTLGRPTRTFAPTLVVAPGRSRPEKPRRAAPRRLRTPKTRAR